MTYFELYEIPISFLPNAKALKRKFYKLSKKYHPDFYTLAPAKKQAEILELSSLNNEAYKILTDLDKRVKYILDLKGVMQEEGKNKLPTSFLMEMMDINENLMELEFDFDQSAYDNVLKAVIDKEKNLYDSVALIFESYQDEKATKEELNAVKDFYLKKRYLLRIRENLSKFASL